MNRKKSTRNLKELDVVIMASNRWDAQFSSAIHCLAKEIAKSRRVFYINRPFTFFDYIKGRKNEGKLKDGSAIRGLGGKTLFEAVNPNLVAVKVPLTLPINWVSNKFLYKSLKRINDYIIHRSVRAIQRQYDLKEFVYLNSYCPVYAGVLPQKMSAVNIYQSRDDISQNPYTGKHGVWLEFEAAAKADIVITTSIALQRKLIEVNESTHNVYNAADFDLFNKAVIDEIDRPEDIQSLVSPVVAYTGNLDGARVDFQLLKAMIDQYPSVSFLFVGPISQTHFEEYGLDKKDNVICVGSKPIEQLPAYLKYVDLTIIPFKKNKLTESIYPLKINEYLAAGKTVVSTNFSEDIRSFEDVIHITDSHQDFIQAISSWLANETDQSITNSRLQFAKNNTWSARVTELENILEQSN